MLKEMNKLIFRRMKLSLFNFNFNNKNVGLMSFSSSSSFFSEVDIKDKAKIKSQNKNKNINIKKIEKIEKIPSKKITSKEIPSRANPSKKDLSKEKEIPSRNIPPNKLENLTNDEKEAIQNASNNKNVLANYVNFISIVNSSCQDLERLPYDTLNNCIKKFRTQILLEKNKENIRFNEFLENVPTNLRNDREVLYNLLNVMEFIDKSKKGLLTGDLSALLIRDIKICSQEFLEKFPSLCNKYNIDFENYMRNNAPLKLIPLHITITDVIEQNVKLMRCPSLTSPVYIKSVEELYNFDKFDKFDKCETLQNSKITPTKSTLQNNNYKNNNNHNSSSENNLEINQKRINSNISGKKQASETPEESEEKRNSLKLFLRDLNLNLNEMYDKILMSALKLDPFRIPFHGIEFPEKENPYNLFLRQLFVEDKSRSLANQDCAELMLSLIQLDKLGNVPAFTRFLRNWIQKFETLYELGIENTHNRIIKEILKGIQAVNISAITFLTILKMFMGNLNLSDENSRYLLNSSNSIEIPAANICMSIAKNLNVKGLYKKYQIKKEENYLNEEDPDSQKLSEIGLSVKVGAFLTKLFIESCPRENWIISHEIVRVNSKKLRGYIRCNSEFVKELIDTIIKTNNPLIQLDRALPMIYKPSCWASYNLGGYYLYYTNLIRIEGHEYPIKHALKVVDSSKFRKSLDIVSQVKWRINKEVLDTVEFFWSKGGGVGTIPLKYVQYQITDEQLQSTKGKDKINLLNKLNELRNTHSLRCEFLLRLQICQSFKKVSEIYFPHNFDFRGRAYPLPPHLNHMGPDIVRGLLEFGESKKLGPKGLYWMKINLANAIGYDKYSFENRVKYIDSIIDEIHKCAENPRENLFWLNTENPWQALANMFEISKAIKSGNPGNYETHLHAHVDGSFNGMQHYTALGRDFNAATAVNLIDSDKPSDVYSVVLNEVKKQLSSEDNADYKEIASILTKNIERKTIKQPVMTSVYGVTFVGARKQIERQLKEKKDYQSDLSLLLKTSYYLTKLVLNSLGNLFADSDRIKKWLLEVSKICSKNKHKVNWINPFGLPCIQPYLKNESKKLFPTEIQSFVLYFTKVYDDDDKIDSRKQTSAFPPNFIHSLDASHMLYTANECHKKNICFAAVHDSYWCHPCDVEEMSKELRKQFVLLHNEPILERLKSDLECTNPGLKLPEIPSKGNFDLNNVLTSKYFFA